jgi:hypothetical protein
MVSDLMEMEYFILSWVVVLSPPNKAFFFLLEKRFTFYIFEKCGQNPVRCRNIKNKASEEKRLH